MIEPGRNDTNRLTPDEPAASGDERFSFERFARHQFFKQANAWLVSHAGIRPNSAVVDLACGPGAVTELILQELDETDAEARVYAIDPSPSALALARKRIQSPIVRFIEGSAERLASLVPPVDVVVCTNAIHLIADKLTAFEQMFSTLRRGGALGFNTSFFEGAYPEETRRFYKLWVLRAVRWLKERGYAVSRGVKATAMQWLTVDEYRALLRTVGFDEPVVELQEKALSRESLEDIGQFSLFIEGALPGVPLEIGAEALIHGVRQAFEELKLSSVPRNWLQVVARHA
jgi:ubiquinone/menaquinone biosynthesis C-methylase UbiE